MTPLQPLPAISASDSGGEVPVGALVQTHQPEVGSPSAVFGSHHSEGSNLLPDASSSEEVAGEVKVDDGGSAESMVDVQKRVYAQSLYQLRALIWKNFVLKRRYYMQSVMEIIAPMALLSVLVLGWSLAEVETFSPRHYVNETLNQEVFDMLSETAQNVIDNGFVPPSDSCEVYVCVDDVFANATLNGTALIQALNVTNLTQSAEVLLDALGDAGFGLNFTAANTTLADFLTLLTQANTTGADITSVLANTTLTFNATTFGNAAAPDFLTDLGSAFTAGNLITGLNPGGFAITSGSEAVRNGCTLGTCIDQALNSSSIDPVKIFNAVFQFNGPFPVIPLDLFYSLSNLVRDAIGVDNVDRFEQAAALVSRSFGNLLGVGDLYFTPASDETAALVRYLNSTYTSFSTIYSGTLEDEDVAVAETTKLDNRRTFAVVVVNSASAEELSYTIRMNFTVLPRTTRLENRFSRALDPSYLRYHTSGFLSLQAAIDSYAYNSTGSSTPTMVTAPFPTPQYNRNIFYDAVGPLIGLVMCMATLYPVSRLIKSIVEERETRMKETLLIMGCKRWVIPASWILTYIAIFTVIAGLLTWMLGGSVFSFSDNTLLFLFFWLFFLSLISMGFLLASLFNRAKLAGIVGPLVLFAAVMPRYIFFDSTDEEGQAVKTLMSLLSPTAFAFAADSFTAYEGAEIGVQWNNLSEGNFSISIILTMFIVDTVIYGVLAWYLGLVMPSEYGRQQHPLFFLQPLWRFAQRVMGVSVVKAQVGDSEVVASDDVEQLDSSLLHKVTVRVRNICKQFGDKKVAVDGVSLNMVQGEVTALLGHNGAGKTTLVSMLTGLIGLSSGSATIKGLPLKTGMNKIRESIGICPQQNVIYDKLTVKEHLQLFSAIKGVHGSAIKRQVNDKVQEVGLEEKFNVFAERLSGGQKRKLCVAMAFIGGSDIVFLDECTSGMDAWARRATWELIRRYKYGRTIVLTTHFMEEADLLADSIAIMAKGKLRCCGSSLFLKKRFGIGYNCVLTKARPDCDINSVDSLIRKHISEAQPLTCAAGEISYQLPLGKEQAFVSLFADIEEQRDVLGVGGYGMSMTTLEEVFIKLAMENHVEDGNGKNEEAGSSALIDVPVEDPCGNLRPEDLRKAWLTQFRWLMWKRLKSAIRDRKSILTEVLAPVFTVLLVLFILRIQWRPVGPPLSMSTEMWSSESEVAISRPTEDVWKSLELGKAKPYEIEANNSLQVSETLLDQYYAHPLPRQGALAVSDTVFQNFTFLNTTVTPAIPSGNTVLHNTSKIHALPAFINELSNARLALSMSSQNRSYKGIETFNHPLPLTEFQSSRVRSILSLFAALFLLIPFGYLPATYAVFVVKEKSVGSQHLQLVSGVNVSVYWCSTFLADLIHYGLLMLFLMLVFYIQGATEFVGDSVYFSATLSLFTLFGAATIPLSYCYSFMFESPSSCLLGITSMHFMSGFVFTVGSFVMGAIEETKAANDVLVEIYRLFPTFNFGEGLINLAALDFQNFLSGSKANPFEWNTLGRPLVYMAAETVVLFLFTILLQSGLIQVAYRRVKSSVMVRLGPVARRVRMYIRPQKDSIIVQQAPEDEDVAMERQLIEEGDSHNSMTIITHKLRKEFGEKVAVKSLSMGVRKGECFGLLGVNGAGKSTTMSMLTGQFPPTSGWAKVMSKDVVQELAVARRQMGLCPQHDPILGHLSVKDHLLLFAGLKGIPSKLILPSVNYHIHNVGLSDFVHKPAGNLSGGNKRKLSLAIALIGNPSVVFLDEPSSGIDVVARRHMWKVIEEAARTRSVVLTSHSMEECEAMCARIGIMVGGELRCLGSTQHLKSRHGQGYQIELQSEGHLIDSVDSFVRSEFAGAVLEEFHGGRLRYQIPKMKTSLSHIFGRVEENRQRLGIKDYSIAQSTLEQVFIAIARAQRDDGTVVDAEQLRVSPEEVVAAAEHARSLKRLKVSSVDAPSVGAA